MSKNSLMKFLYTIIPILLLVPMFFLSKTYVQAADELCTGPIYTDATASQKCADLAEAQGKARGYTITCTSKQVGFPFTDTTTGLNYYFDATCTVNGYDGNGAQLLAGYTGFTGQVNGRYLTWGAADPGWDTLAANLKSYAAVEKCGGYNYAVNAAGEYYCLPTPTQTTTPTTPTTPTQTTNSANITTNQLTSQSAYVQNLINVVNNIIQKYKNLSGLNTETINTTGSTNTSTNSSTAATTNISSVTVNADVLNVRQAPNTQSGILGQLKAGNTFTAACYVVGENVEGTSKWWKTSSGSFIWAGGTVGQPSGANTLCESTASTSNTNTASTFDAWVSASGSRIGTIAAVGETISYAWSSTGAVSAVSTYTADAPDNCSGGILSQGEIKPWIASTLYGNSSAAVQECQAWRTYTINYKVKNSINNELTKPITVKIFPRCVGQIYTDAADSQACAALTEKVGKVLGHNIVCASKQVGLPSADPNTGLNYYYDATCTLNRAEGLGAQLLAGYSGYSGPIINGRNLTWSSNSSGWNNYTSIKPVTTAQNASDTRMQQIISVANVLQYNSLTSDEKNALFTYLTLNGTALLDQNFQTFAPGSVFAWALSMGTETTLNAAAKSLGFTTFNPVAGVFVKTPGYTIQ